MMTNRNLGTGFKATGKGLNVALPHSSANEKTGNIYFENTLLGEGNPLKSIWGFCPDFQTQWVLSGKTAQSPYARIFYGHNMTQQPLAITLQFPNQYERDKMIEFVEASQHTALDFAAKNRNSHSQTGVDITINPRIKEFKDGDLQAALHQSINYPPNSARYRYVDDALRVSGFIQVIEAGANNVTFAPQLVIQVQVAYDYKQAVVDMPALINDTLQRRHLNDLLPYGTAQSVSATPTTKPDAVLSEQQANDLVFGVDIGLFKL